MVINKDWRDVLINRDYVECVFADPPDNIGLSYNGYQDRIPDDDYYQMLWQLIKDSFVCSLNVAWISYNAVHDIEISHMVRDIFGQGYKNHVRKIIWRYTFGQYNKHDFTSGYRPILRIVSGKTYPEAVLEPSMRELLGDLRANKGGRVPDDVWEIPRVTGNSKERRPWHPTQHPEALIERIIKFSTKEGDTVFDCFAGTGTVERVAKRLNRQSVSCEIDPFYCQKIEEENG